MKSCRIEVTPGGITFTPTTTTKTVTRMVNGVQTTFTESTAADLSIAECMAAAARIREDQARARMAEKNSRAAEEEKRASTQAAEKAARHAERKARHAAKRARSEKRRQEPSRQTTAATTIDGRAYNGAFTSAPPAALPMTMAATTTMRTNGLRVIVTAVDGQNLVVRAYEKSTSNGGRGTPTFLVCGSATVNKDAVDGDTLTVYGTDTPSSTTVFMIDLDAGDVVETDNGHVGVVLSGSIQIHNANGIPMPLVIIHDRPVVAMKCAVPDISDFPTKDGDARELECVLCMTNRVRMAAQPCGHANYCHACAKRMEKASKNNRAAAAAAPECAVCKGRIDMFVKCIL